jgi:hypothetical protein
MLPENGDTATAVEVRVGEGGGSRARDEEVTIIVIVEDKGDVERELWEGRLGVCELSRIQDEAEWGLINARRAASV